MKPTPFLKKSTACESVSQSVCEKVKLIGSPPKGETPNNVFLVLASNSLLGTVMVIKLVRAVQICIAIKRTQPHLVQ